MHIHLIVMQPAPPSPALHAPAVQSIAPPLPPPRHPHLHRKAPHTPSARMHQHPLPRQGHTRLQRLQAHRISVAGGIQITEGC